MKIFVAPLNWGLGHATRCIPLIEKFLSEKHEVVLGGDGQSLLLLRQHFPNLRVLTLANLQLSYSKSNRQVWAMMKNMPKIIVSSICDHYLLRKYISIEHFDVVVSDNRFGLFNKQIKSYYLTHQLNIFLPAGWKWLEPLARWIHKQIYTHYDECWIPDSADNNLSGDLAHGNNIAKNVKYIGLLSRFSLIKNTITPNIPCSPPVVAILSGLEPQRTLFEEQIINAVEAGRFGTEQVMIIEGRIGEARTHRRRGQITLVANVTDAELLPLLLNAKTIIARSGYSTIMDLACLDLLNRAILIPTPGQPEQEYLATIHNHIHTNTVLT